MKTVLFVAPCALLSNGPTDGFLRRVGEIDRLLDEHKYRKDYLVISGRGNIIGYAKSHGASNIFYYNRFLHQRAIRELAKHYDLLYVHSVYQARQIISLYTDPVTRIYTDMHGAVPEELQMYGYSPRRIVAYNNIESIVVNRSDKMVFVTHAMRKHFEHKYKKDISESGLIIPSLYRRGSTRLSPNEQCSLRKKMGMSENVKLVIYSGGTSKWQKIDAMLEIIDSSLVNNQLAYILLTNNLKELSRLVHQRMPGCNRVFLDSVLPTALGPYYDVAQAGILLRDDNVVNRVACPTKLVEYLAHGLYPIMSSPYIGDFLDQGGEYIAANSIANDLDGFVERLTRRSSVNGDIYEKYYRPDLYSNFIG